jgi:hypothetical protein
MVGRRHGVVSSSMNRLVWGSSHVMEEMEQTDHLLPDSVAHGHSRRCMTVIGRVYIYIYIWSVL